MIERSETLTVLVQHILIRWSKSSRGGVLAERRNRIPRAFSLPSPEPRFDRTERFTVHKIEFGESNQFHKPLHITVDPPLIDIPYRSRNCTVEANREFPVVRYEYRDGAPPRTYIDKEGISVPVMKTFSIAENQWVQIEHNGRFSCRDFGIWSYEHEIINVAFTDPKNRAIFTTTQPTETYQQLADLW
ncbi:MAG: hypothetical protein KDA84_17425 [Planctomycetaceae bacterium]|nr:hypothetical protein [Planctomycetaceae bacterium]